jgi:hypothetical protein
MDDTPIEINTFEELTEYAHAHFPEVFAKLPPKSCYTFEVVDGDWEQCQILVGTTLIAQNSRHHTTFTSIPVYAYLESHWKSNVTGLYFKGKGDDIFGNVHLAEPFCRICPEIQADVYDPGLHNYIRYCFGLLGHDPPDGYMVDLESCFQDACVAVVEGQQNEDMMGLGEQTRMSDGK